MAPGFACDNNNNCDQTKLLRKKKQTCCTPPAVYAIFSHMPWRSLRFQLYVFQESISVHPNIIVTLSSKFPFLSGLRQNEKQTMSSLLSLCWKGKVKPKQRFEWNVKLHEVKFIQKLTSWEFSFWWLRELLQGLNFVLAGQR